MEKEIKEDILDISQRDNKVHVVLAHSYVVFFMLFLVGVFLDLIFNLKFFNFEFLVPLGIIFILLASILIFWAQKTSRNFKRENLTKESFNKGPYFFTRCPTHLGLFLLTLGFGLIANAIFIVISSAVSFLITKFVYLNHEEAILEKKYGNSYKEYKASVKF